MDVARILRLLTDAQVDVVLVGGMAAVAHGVVHLTNDIALCYNPDLANLERLVRATELLTLMTDAGRLDLIRVILGVGGYADVHSVAIPLDVLGAHINTLDLPGLIESKRAVRRPKDLAARPHIEAVLRMREADAENR